MINMAVGTLRIKKGPKPHDPACGGRIVPDVRTDNTWMPPHTEKRERCLKCRWQGPWWVVRDEQG